MLPGHLMLPVTYFSIFIMPLPVESPKMALISSTVLEKIFVNGRRRMDDEGCLYIMVTL